MRFEKSIRPRFDRYRREADETLAHVSAAEEVSRRFSERFFETLAATAALLEKSGFGIESEVGEGRVRVSLEAGPGATSEAVFALLPGAAAETDEYLMHEELSRHTLAPAGYSGRILGWKSPGERPCQTFAVYADGTWRTKGIFVEKSRGKVDDSDDVLAGFCARIVGRMVDLAVPTDGAGRTWQTDFYTLSDLDAGDAPPTETRWLK